MARKSKSLNEAFKQLAEKPEADIQKILNESNTSNDEIDSIVNQAAVDDFKTLCEEFNIDGEFFNKVKELIETAIDTRVQKEVIRIEKEYDDKYERAEKILSDNLNEQFESINNKDKTLTEDKEILQAELEAKYIQLQNDLEESVEIKIQEYDARIQELDEKAAEYGAYVVEEFSKHAQDYIDTEVVGKVDKYINYIAEQFLENNEVAIDSSIKSELTESFMEKLKTLFESHYIDIPDSKLDVLQQQSNKISRLETKLNEQIAINNTLKKDKVLNERRSIINSFCEDLSDNEAEKFKQLAESVSDKYSSLEAFKRSLSVLKGNSKLSTSSKSNFLSEAIESASTSVFNKKIEESNSKVNKTDANDKALEDFKSSILDAFKKNK